MRPLIPTLVVATLLQACTIVMSPPVSPTVPLADLASCHAVGLHGLIGSPVSLLPKYGSWSSLRIIRPGQMVTMDYSATRLNVRVNGADIILSLTCG